MQLADLGPLGHPDHLRVLLARSTRRPCLAPVDHPRGIAVSECSGGPFSSVHGVPFHLAATTMSQHSACCTQGGWRGGRCAPSTPGFTRPAGPDRGGFRPEPPSPRRRVDGQRPHGADPPARVAGRGRRVAGQGRRRRAAVRPATAGHDADVDLDRGGGRGRARAHPPGRPHRQQPEPDGALRERPGEADRRRRDHRLPDRHRARGRAPGPRRRRTADAVVRTVSVAPRHIIWPLPARYADRRPSGAGAAPSRAAERPRQLWLPLVSTSIIRRQWSLDPHSAASFIARTDTLL